MPRPENPRQPEQPSRERPRSSSSARRKPNLHKHARGRYAAISDRRHGKQSNLAFLIGGGFAVCIVLVVIITATSMTTSADRELAARAEAETAAAEELARATAAADAAKLAAGKAESSDTSANSGETEAPSPEPATPAAPVAPAPDVTLAQLDWDALTVGPWSVKPSGIMIDDSYECPRATINTALGETLILKPSAPDRKLMVVYLTVEPKQDYTADQRSALAALPILSQGQRKLGDDEWVLVSSHFEMATINPATGARAAVKPMLLFAEDAEAGFAIAGSDDKSRLDFAVFASDPTELVLVFEVHPDDKAPVLITRPVPGLKQTPGYVLRVTDSGTMGSAGHAPLVELDPSLAPGEARAKPGDAASESQ